MSGGARMKIEYKSTIDEATDTSFRLVELLGTVRKQMWYGLAMAPIIFVAIFLLIDDLPGKLIVGGAASVLWVPYHLSNNKSQIKKRIRKSLIKAMGTSEPLSCEYELDENGLVFRKLGQELRFSWFNVMKMNESDNAIEVIMQPMGIAIIPKRIFGGPDEIKKWIQFIEEHKTSNKHIEHPR
jgi:hypothetical protein